MQIVEEMDRALLDLRNRIIQRLEISRATSDTSATSSAPVSRHLTSEIEEVDEDPPPPPPNNYGMASWVNSIEREDVEQWLEDVEIISSRDTKRQLESEEEPMLSDFEADLLTAGLRRPMSSSSVEVVQFSSACGSIEWAAPLGRQRKVKPLRSCRRESNGESSDWVDAAGDSDSTFG